ncbi:MAG: cytochrome C [Rhodobacteraceae bacterium]|nr:MAG: cytochrome C [Paracoccaceae bacterium]
MGKWRYIVGVLGLAVIAAGVLVYSNNEKQQLQLDTSVGAALYAASCASCHGANLQGEPDWQTTKPDGFLPAPPHDENGHTWHHADRILLDYIKLGGAAALAKSGVENFQSGMPAFEGVLSSDEIDALLDYIKSSWPENIRTVQQDRTKLDEEINP